MSNVVNKIRGFEGVSETSIENLIRKVKLEGKPNVYVSEEVLLPRRGTSKSAGYDIINPVNGAIIIKPNEKVLIWTNVKSYMQDNEVLIAVVRSSMGIKLDLSLANTLGVIDSDYYDNPNNEGNIGVCLRNTGNEQVVIQYGDAIGQAIFLPYLVSDNCNTEERRVSGIG